MVLYFEDRVPTMTRVNESSVEEEKEWWAQPSPYVAHDPRPVFDQPPGLRVIDISGLKSDRRLPMDTEELAYTYLVQARLCRVLYRLNRELADAVRAYLE